MKKLKQEQEIKKNKQGTRVLWFVVVLLALFGAARVIMANVSVDNSGRLNQLETRIRELEMENEMLAMQLDSETSLLVLSKRSEIAGFGPSQKVSYASSPMPIALKMP